MSTPHTPSLAKQHPAQLPAPRVLITAGPTHEPIDAVRYLGNRSSGRMGCALADACCDRGWPVTLLLGPTALQPGFARAEPANEQQGKAPSPRHHAVAHASLVSFRTCADLQTLLATHVRDADILIMAAAVADYRPMVDPQFFGGKFRRKNENLMLELEPTPDLLAGVAADRRPDQLMVGFALEPRAEMLGAALDKMRRKKIDMVVANPLETMDSPTIEAVVLTNDGERRSPGALMTKEDFAPWLLDAVAAAWIARGTGRER